MQTGENEKCGKHTLDKPKSFLYYMYVSTSISSSVIIDLFLFNNRYNTNTLVWKGQLFYTLSGCAF